MRLFQFIIRWSQLRGDSSEAAILDERDRQLEDWLNELAASGGGGGGGGDMLRSNNLSDVLSVSTARSNLGLGAFATATSSGATALLDQFTSTTKGVVPASGGGSTNFLRADGTWAAPPGGSGGGSSSSSATFDGGDSTTASFTSVINGGASL
ncbi:MAG: hypothetical protein RL134_2538 [Actinomycetota bacterium]|jgi:hypothetical protein